MNTILMRSFSHIVVTILLLFSPGYANAIVFNLNGSFDVNMVSGTDLIGLVDTGDKVFVEAFYDTDLAVRGEFSTVFQGVPYTFPLEGASIRYTVNNLTWQTTGLFPISVTPTAMMLLHSDGSVAATYGGPEWIGETSFSSPFGTENGRGLFMYYLPKFSTELIPANFDLPTDLTINQLAGPNFVHGAVSGIGPNGNYFFNFSSPIPEPKTYLLTLVGLGLVGLITVKRRKQPYISVFNAAFNSTNLSNARALHHQ